MARKLEDFVHHFYQQHRGHCMSYQCVMILSHRKTRVVFIKVAERKRQQIMVDSQHWHTKTPCSHQSHRCSNLCTDFILEFNHLDNFLHLRQIRVEVRILFLSCQSSSSPGCKNWALIEKRWKQDESAWDRGVHTLVSWDGYYADLFNNLSRRLVTLYNMSGRNEEKVCEGSQST